MEKEIPISVIMLTFNREDMLSSMIESIIDQTFEHFEYIIIDNGSSDRSGIIAEEYKKRDNRIKVIHVEKGTIGKGRNIGLSYAKGQFVAFVDDDDICERTYLEELFSCVKESSNTIAVCGTDRSVISQSRIFSSREAMEALLDRKYFNVGFPTKLIPRKFFEQDLFDETAKFDDIRLMPAMIAQAEKVHYIAKPLYIVRRHDGNNSAWTTDFAKMTSEILNEYLLVYSERTEWLKDIFPQETELWEYYEWSFMISMWNKIKQYEVESCYKLREQLEIELKKKNEIYYCFEKTTDFERCWIEEMQFESQRD